MFSSTATEEYGSCAMLLGYGRWQSPQGRRCKQEGGQRNGKQPSLAGSCSGRRKRCKLAGKHTPWLNSRGVGTRAVMDSKLKQQENGEECLPENRWKLPEQVADRRKWRKSGSSSTLLFLAEIHAGIAPDCSRCYTLERTGKWSEDSSNRNLEDLTGIATEKLERMAVEKLTAGKGLAGGRWAGKVVAGGDDRIPYCGARVFWFWIHVGGDESATRRVLNPIPISNFSIMPP